MPRERCRRGRFVLALVTLLITGPMREASLAQERNHASWWIKSYGLVDASTEPLTARVEDIFTRLAAAADKRANRFPRLAILDTDGNPFAMALPDGTILLTRGALNICYGNVPQETGDARLAFVIAHELSHLGNDDFWHAAAFDAIDLNGKKESVRSTLRDLFQESPEARARRELQADAYGMLYMTTAGYDPQVLFRKESFFEEWATALDVLGVRTTARHPSPAERGAFLRTQLSAIGSEIDFFHFGTRLVQLGRLKDGLLLLERFRDRFPSREVLNNIGVAHYQLAARYLGSCDGRLVVRFKLPTVLDSSTRAVRLRSGGGSSPCFRAERFRLHFREAERNLTEASEMDPSYAPTAVNLLSLYALAARGAQAIVASEKAKETSPDDPRVQAGAAVALYLYGEESGVEMADTAIEQLQKLRELHGHSAEVLYNLGTMLAERRRVQAAEEAYRAFLTIEPRGVLADAARDYLGVPAVEAMAPPGNIPNLPESPLELGPANRESLSRRHPDVTFEDFVIGDFNGSFLRFDGVRALAIDGTIELVEHELQEAVPLQSLRGIVPRETLTTENEKILIFGNEALVVRGGQAVRLLYFKN